MDVYNLKDFDFSAVDIAVFATSEELSKHYVPRAIAKKTFVIDCSTAYTTDSDVPLIIAGLNDEKILLVDTGRHPHLRAHRLGGQAAPAGGRDAPQRLQVPSQGHVFRDAEIRGARDAHGAAADGLHQVLSTPPRSFSAAEFAENAENHESRSKQKADKNLLISPTFHFPFFHYSFIFSYL